MAYPALRDPADGDETYLDSAVHDRGSCQVCERLGEPGC